MTGTIRRSVYESGAVSSVLRAVRSPNQKTTQTRFRDPLFRTGWVATEILFLQVIKLMFQSSSNRGNHDYITNFDGQRPSVNGALTAGMKQTPQSGSTKILPTSAAKQVSTTVYQSNSYGGAALPIPQFLAIKKLRVSPGNEKSNEVVHRKLPLEITRIQSRQAKVRAQIVRVIRSILNLRKG